MISPKDVFEPSVREIAIADAMEVALDAYLTMSAKFMNSIKDKKRVAEVNINDLLNFLIRNERITRQMAEKCPESFSKIVKEVVANKRNRSLLENRYDRAWNVSFGFVTGSTEEIYMIAFTEK